MCNSTAVPNSNITFINDTTCVNWNYYYTECKGQGNNPFQGTISFDNIGLAWVAIFLVISLEGWTDIMYYVQDAHSFWDWIYFVLLIVVSIFYLEKKQEKNYKFEYSYRDMCKIVSFVLFTTLKSVLVGYGDQKHHTFEQYTCRSARSS